MDFLRTVDLCDASAALHSDPDVNPSEALLPQQQHGLQELPEHTGFSPSPHGGGGTPPRLELTLYWRVAGSSISRGLPLTFRRPFPRLQWATAVAVF